MKWTHYMKDQIMLLSAFIFILIVVTLLILLDPALTMEISSLVYLDLLIICIISTYFCVDYFNKRATFQLLKTLEEIDLSNVPSVSGYLNQQYIVLLKKQEAEWMQVLAGKDAIQKEWLEYMTTWFHEIKTPIAVSKMIFETDGNLDSLEEELEKIDYFIEQALYTSRLSEFHTDYLIHDVEIERIINESVKKHAKMFLSKKIKLSLMIDSFEVLSDKKGMLFVINQLLSNALKYTPKYGEITISTNRSGKMISIRDNGRGIEEEDLPRIFERGFTGANGRKYSTSTGMGLFLAKKTADKLGHQLIITSEKNKFTEAEIYFSNGSALHYTFDRTER